MTNEDSPSRDELEEALFETCAALADLRSRLAGGAQESNVSAEQVVDEVWSAYDLVTADDVASRSDFTRDGHDTPSGFAIDELVARDTPVGNVDSE